MHVDWNEESVRSFWRKKLVKNESIRRLCKKQTHPRLQFRVLRHILSGNSELENRIIHFVCHTLLGAFPKVKNKLGLSLKLVSQSISIQHTLYYA